MQAPNWTRKRMHVVDHTLNECEVSLAQDLIAGIEHACFFFMERKEGKLHMTAGPQAASKITCRPTDPYLKKICLG